MLSHALSALTARRNAVKEGEKGFTLIELLVVVIIIGILAAIAIPVYLGIQGNAKDSAVKSDLNSAKTAVVAYYTQTPDATTAPTLDQTGLGFTPTVTLTYSPAPTTSGTTFCIQGTSQTSKVFHVGAAGGVADGGCTP